METESLKGERERGRLIDGLRLLKTCDWMEFREHMSEGDRQGWSSYVIDK